MEQKLKCFICVSFFLFFSESVASTFNPEEWIGRLFDMSSGSPRLKSLAEIPSEHHDVLSLLLYNAQIRPLMKEMLEHMAAVHQALKAIQVQYSKSRDDKRQILAKKIAEVTACVDMKSPVSLTPPSKPLGYDYEMLIGHMFRWDNGTRVLKWFSQVDVPYRRELSGFMKAAYVARGNTNMVIKQLVEYMADSMDLLKEAHAELSTSVQASRLDLADHIERMSSSCKRSGDSIRSSASSRSSRSSVSFSSDAKDSTTPSRGRSRSKSKDPKEGEDGLFTRMLRSLSPKRTPSGAVVTPDSVASSATVDSAEGQLRASGGGFMGAVRSLFSPKKRSSSVTRKRDADDKAKDDRRRVRSVSPGKDIAGDMARDMADPSGHLKALLRAQTAQLKEKDAVIARLTKENEELRRLVSQRDESQKRLITSGQKVTDMEKRLRESEAAKRDLERRISEQGTLLASRDGTQVRLTDLSRDKAALERTISNLRGEVDLYKTTQARLMDKMATLEQQVLEQQKVEDGLVAELQKFKGQAAAAASGTRVWIRRKSGDDSKK